MTTSWTERIRYATEPIKNVMQMMREPPYQFFEDRRARLGDLFELRMPGQPSMFVCSDPEGVRQLVSSSYEQMSRFGGGVEFFVDPMTLIRMNDEPHRLRRKLLGPSFNVEHVRAFGQTMLEITNRVLAGLPSGRSLPLIDAMRDITMRVIIRCMFGVDEGPRLEELRVLVVEYMNLMLAPELAALGAMRSPAGAYETIVRLSRRARARPVDAPVVPSRLPLRRIADRLGRILALLEAECEQRLAEGAEGREDVLSRMLLAKFEDGQPMAREEVLAQQLMMVIGGYAATAETLCWAVHCLLQHPEAQAKLRAEVTAVMGDGFDAARVRDLSYVGAVIDESMRLFPIGVGISRKLKQPMQIAGRELPVDTVVMANIYRTQRNPALWDDPETFKPERMLEKRRPGYLLFPFGAGVWRCIGAAFAEHEMRIVLARLFTHFEVQPDPSVEVRPERHTITIGPSHGLPVIVTPRAGAAS